MVSQNPPQILPITQTIEAWVDAKFDSTPIPHPIRDVSLWHLLTVCEDMARMHFNGMIEKSPNEIEQLIDELKYSMKHCTQRVLTEAKFTESYRNRVATLRLAMRFLKPNLCNSIGLASF